MKAGYLGLKQTDTYTGQQAGLSPHPPSSLIASLWELVRQRPMERQERHRSFPSAWKGKVSGLSTPYFYDPIVILENSACPLPMISRH